MSDKTLGELFADYGYGGLVINNASAQKNYFYLDTGNGTEQSELVFYTSDGKYWWNPILSENKWEYLTNPDFINLLISNASNESFKFTEVSPVVTLRHDAANGRDYYRLWDFLNILYKEVIMPLDGGGYFSQNATDLGNASSHVKLGTTDLAVKEPITLRYYDGATEEFNVLPAGAYLATDDGKYWALGSPPENDADSVFGIVYPVLPADAPDGGDGSGSDCPTGCHTEKVVHRLYINKNRLSAKDQPLTGSIAIRKCVPKKQKERIIFDCGIIPDTGGTTEDSVESAPSLPRGLGKVDSRIKRG